MTKPRKPYLSHVGVNYDEDGNPRPGFAIRIPLVGISQVEGVADEIIHAIFDDAKAQLEQHQAAQTAHEKLSRTNRPVVERIRELRQAGLSDGQIAIKLNDEGHRKRNGKPYTAADVKSRRHYHKIR